MWWQYGALRLASASLSVCTQWAMMLIVPEYYILLALWMHINDVVQQVHRHYIWECYSCSWHGYTWGVWCSAHSLCKVVRFVFCTQIATCWRRSYWRDPQWQSQKMPQGSLEEMATQKLQLPEVWPSILAIFGPSCGGPKWSKWLRFSRDYREGSYQ